MNIVCVCLIPILYIYIRWSVFIVEYRVVVLRLISVVWSDIRYYTFFAAVVGCAQYDDKWYILYYCVYVYTVLVTSVVLLITYSWILTVYVPLILPLKLPLVTLTNHWRAHWVLLLFHYLHYISWTFFLLLLVKRYIHLHPIQYRLFTLYESTTQVCRCSVVPVLVERYPVYCHTVLFPILTAFTVLLPVHAPFLKHSDSTTFHGYPAGCSLTLLIQLPPRLFCLQLYTGLPFDAG